MKTMEHMRLEPYKVEIVYLDSGREVYGGVISHYYNIDDKSVYLNLDDGRFLVREYVAKVHVLSKSSTKKEQARD